MRFSTYNVLLALVTSLCVSGCGFKSESADSIVHNGTIITMDAQNSIGRAMAIRNGRILAIGAEREILNRYRATEVTRLERWSRFSRPNGWSRTFGWICRRIIGGKLVCNGKLGGSGWSNGGT